MICSAIFMLFIMWDENVCPLCLMMCLTSIAFLCAPACKPINKFIKADYAIAVVSVDLFQKKNIFFHFFFALALLKQKLNKQQLDHKRYSPFVFSLSFVYAQLNTISRSRCRFILCSTRSISLSSAYIFLFEILAVSCQWNGKIIIMYDNALMK